MLLQAVIQEKRGLAAPLKMFQELIRAKIRRVSRNAFSRRKCMRILAYRRSRKITQFGTESGTQFVAKRYKTLYSVERAAAEG